MSEADDIDRHFITCVRGGELPQTNRVSLSDAGLSGEAFIELFSSQILSRQLDLQSRKMQARGESFYTIGSAGHEGNAAIAAAFRVGDMAFLHYRDAAFFIQRSKQLPDQNPLRDLLLSFAASSRDPIAGGRHKVLGSKSLFVPPQTSTIASHLPKAVGAATSIGLNRHLKRAGTLADDAVILCSFGDASFNHSTAQGAINTAGWMAYRNLQVPLVFICEDNGIGISTPTPEGWIESSMRNRPGIAYFACDGLNLLDTYHTACEVEQYVRGRRKPAFLHMRCVRMMGHAGSDVQSTYLTEQQIGDMHGQDPLLYSARIAIENGLLSGEAVASLYEKIGAEVEAMAHLVAKEPKLTSAQEVMASIVPPRRAPTKNTRAAMANVAPLDKPLSLNRMINLALHEVMQSYPEIILAGEDVGKKGGVYGVTQKLSAQFGPQRVIDTILDEQSILGLAIGLGHNNLLPIVEIQFLAYLHNAEDQLRGEAATLSFFSQGQYTNPMIIRIAGLAYQRGFGGHFHNDNGIAVLRDIPGVIVACPSNGRDAVGMLRECVRLAREEQRVVIFLEPIALYTMRDLHQAGDDQWCSTYQEARDAKSISLGEVARHGDGEDLAVITYGNGYFLSRQATEALKASHGIDARVIDMRWLKPLPMEAILKELGRCMRVLIVDECRETGSPSEELYTKLAEARGSELSLARLCATDSFIPLGKAATLTLPSKQSIVEAALSLLEIAATEGVARKAKKR